VRGPFARSLLLLAVPVAGALAIAGGLALRGPGLVTVLVVAGLVGGTTAGLLPDVRGGSRSAAIDAGVRAFGWTAGGLLVLAGVAALAGPLVMVLVGGAVSVLGVVAGRLLRTAGAPTRTPFPKRDVAPAPPVSPSARTGWSSGPVLVLPPVQSLTSQALGEEWLHTSALLAARLDPVVRRAVVARRESTLDELERRDPIGFARWLADGSGADSNPADFVRDLPAAGTGAA
jgi:hypothetical protein